MAAISEGYIHELDAAEMERTDVRIFECRRILRRATEWNMEGMNQVNGWLLLRTMRISLFNSVPHCKH